MMILNEVIDYNKVKNSVIIDGIGQFNYSMHVLDFIKFPFFYIFFSIVFI